MRILLVTETYPPEVNGVAMTNQRLVRGLRAKGHEVILAKPRRRSDARGADPDGGPVETVFGVPLPNYPGLRFGLPAPGKLGRILRRARPDVVHVATEGPLGWAALGAARRLGLPVTSTFHTNFHEYCADYGAASLRRIALAYLRRFHNRCALTTVPDPGLIAALEAAGVERLALLGRGADTILFSPTRRDPTLRATWGAGEDDPVAIYVGRAAAEKNIPLVLGAWAEARATCPRLRMVVVGDGPVRRKLERRWPEVHFAGMRFDEDLARHYASADLFLFASETETFGNVVLEALASGLATLTYDYAAGGQFVETGRNGRLVTPGDGAAFRAATTAWVAERADWPPVRAAARRTAESMPWSLTIDRFEGMLADAAAGRFSEPAGRTEGGGTRRRPAS